MPVSPDRKTIIREWITALRSGDYQQGQGNLCTRVEEDQEFQYCCLGVLCETLGLNWTESWQDAESTIYAVWDEDAEDYEDAVLPPKFRVLLNMSTSQQDTLTTMNDQEGYHFYEIANAIERMFLPDEAN